MSSKRQGSRKVASFMSVSNYEHLMRVLSRYMAERGTSPDAAGVRLNRLVYKTMTDVDAQHPTMSAYERNKLTVEVVAAFVNNVQGGRGRFVDKRFPPPDPGCPPGQGRPVSDSPIDDIDRRIADLAAARSDVDLGDPYADFQRAMQKSVRETGSTHAAHRPDLAGLRNNIGAPCDPPGSVGGLPGDATAGVGSGADGGAGDSGIIQNDVPKRIVRRYLLINGYDRQWALFPQRFRFSVSLARNDASFKDIRSIAATRLIIPREIVEERTLTNVPKTRFEEPFNLRYPYLILKITDFQNVYKASNTASQSAFCHFIYDRHYTSPSGRGYIHMIPMQNETRTFDINPLSSLEQIDLAVQRPSGVLLNASRDEAKVLRMDWNNQVNMNDQLIMVTLKNFFDRNEYFTGDTVRFTDVTVPGSVAFNGFINREEGHEIMEFGTPNTDGYVRSFYIRVPGSFNAATGLFDIDTAATGDLMAYIDGIDYNSAPPDSIGLVINASLQVTVSFEIRVEEDDVTV